MRRNKLAMGVLCASLVLWMGTAYADGLKLHSGVFVDPQPNPSTKDANPQPTDFLAFTTTRGGGGTAAMVLKVNAQIEGIGKAVVNIDASWQWIPGTYSSDHPCAIVNKSPQTLPDLISRNPKFLYKATVTIASQNGKHVGNVTGGSVCEIEVFSVGQSINQWLISFEIDPAKSTGIFAGAKGQGLIDFKFDSSVVAVFPVIVFKGFIEPYQIRLNID